MGRRAIRRRRVGRGAALVVMAMLVASCHTSLGATSLLLVAPDRTVALDLRCTHAQQTCSGTALLRLAGIDTEAVPFSIGAGEDGAATVTLTDEQYALVPATGYLSAEVVIDDAAPSDAAIRVGGSVGLRRSGTAFTERIGVPVDGGSTSAQVSGGSISGDGRFVAFTTTGAMHPSDTNGTNDVYLRDRLTQTTQWISTDAAGTGPAGGVTPDTSADGRYLVFTTAAALVPSDTNGTGDVYRHDRLTGARTLVSVGAGGQGNNSSGYGSISADGGRVAFTSYATNLVPGDTNGLQDLFVRDVEAGGTVRVSVASDGTQADDVLYTREAHISDDGHHVVFATAATNLVPGDTNDRPDAFVHDLDTATTTRVSVRSDGTQNTSYVQDPVISGDGRFVAFGGANLVPGVPAFYSQAHVHDRLDGTTSAISMAPDGGGPTGGFSTPSDISPDGRFVVFKSRAHNLVSGDTNAAQDVFVRDRATGITARVSLRSDGSQIITNGSGGFDTISDDGRHVAFYSAGLDPDPARPGGWGIFVRDLSG